DRVTGAFPAPPGGAPGQPMVMTLGPGGGMTMTPGGGFGGRGFGGGDRGFGGGGPNSFYGPGQGNDRAFNGPGFRLTDQDIEKKFADLDKNHDGKLSPDEIPETSSLQTNFKTYDTNGDGYIDLAEYKAYFAVQFGADADAGASYGSYNSYGKRDDKKEEPV